MPGTKYANASGELEPERASLSGHAFPSSGDGEVGAGEPAGEEVDSRYAFVDLSDVVNDGDSWRASCDDALAVGVVLTRPREIEACGVESEIEAEAA